VTAPTRISATADHGVDALQLGHINRIDQMSRLLPGDWSGMHSNATGQGDDMGGYRFQLAYGAYALALAHRHRLPNAPAMFQSTFNRLIAKLLEPEAWMYWRDVSRGGSIFNAHLTDRLSEQWDPVVRDNIMYSAYVQSMAAMYNVLFDDDRYTKPGALSFRYWSFFWGGDPKSFEYDQNSLTELLYWRMVENGYLGIACEPNCVFQICNQPAIIGFRMQDLVTGGNVADDVVDGYQRAFEDFGRLGENGHYNLFVLEDSKTVIPNENRPWVDAWCGALMNTWNREFVREHYPRQVADFLVAGRDGTLSVAAQPISYGDLVIDADTNDFGWVAVWASEMGDRATLEGLLAHADRYMNPTWQGGALYYPRNDEKFDQDGHLIRMAPLTGNSLLAYARLNVEDGMWALYNQPWDRSHFAEPLIVERSDNVDITRAVFDRDTRQLNFTVALRDGQQAADAFIEIDNVVEFDLEIDDEVAADSAVARTQDSRLRVQVPMSTNMRLTVPDWEPSS
jgi:Linalool dehydratase/isomerase